MAQPTQPTPIAPTTPTPWSFLPWSQGANLFQQMRREFDQLFERWLGNGLAPLGDQTRWGLDVQDQPEAYVVTAEAPGFEVGDFDINVTDSRLTLRAERKSEIKDREGKRVERSERQLAQSLALPDGIDAEKVEAKYVNGVLTITLPKTKATRGRKVTVRS